MLIVSKIKNLYWKVKRLYILFFNPHLITERTKYLFIFSHMRSRSSLLSHVLGSNSEICGYRELHRSYLNQIDLLETRIDLYHDQKKELHNKYLLDKILHNDHIVSSKIFEIAQPKIIFLLREPKSTFESMINMGYITGIDWYKDPQKVLKYYASRLLELEKYAKQIEEVEGVIFYLIS